MVIGPPVVGKVAETVPLEGMPVVLLLVLRTGEAVADGDVIRALALEAHPPVLEPDALSRRATRALTVTGLGRDVSEDLGRACHDATRGNPFLLVELLRQLRERGVDSDPATVGSVTSERLAAAILLRIGRADPSAPALARAVAVLGESAHLEIAAALAGIEPTGAREPVDALARAEVLERERPLRFVHPLVRTAVYEDMPTSARARLHASAARLLREGDFAADDIALHLLLTDPAGDPAAVETLREAARSAMARGAPDAAIDLRRRAEREPPTEANRAALLLELGTAASRAGHAYAVKLHEHARWEQQSGLGSGVGPVAWRSPAALAHVALGEVDEARDSAAHEVQRARAFGAAPQLGTALRVLGIVESGARGLTLLEEAVAVLERSPARLDHARALVDHGALLRRCGQRKAAVGRLRAGMDLAHRCGATALVAAAAAELRHAGARPRRIAVTGRDALTPSERRVTDLAAQGLTNKEIAQALFVTLRTVEMHLSNSYRKLDISSRE